MSLTEWNVPSKLSIGARKVGTSSDPYPGRTIMHLLKWAIIAFIISLIAGALGFSGISSAAGGIARILFFLFLIIAVIVLVLGLTVFHAVT